MKWFDAAQANDLDYIMANTKKNSGRADQAFLSKTALMYAAGLGYTDLCSYLLDYEAGMRSELGCTALMYAASTEHAAVVRLLVEAEGGLVNNDGDSALVFAVRFYRYENVRILYARECNLVDRSGARLVDKERYSQRQRAANDISGDSAEKEREMTALIEELSAGVKASYDYPSRLDGQDGGADQWRSADDFAQPQFVQSSESSTDVTSTTALEEACLVDTHLIEIAAMTEAVGIQASTTPQKAIRVSSSLADDNRATTPLGCNSRRRNIRDSDIANLEKRTTLLEKANETLRNKNLLLTDTVMRQKDELNITKGILRAVMTSQDRESLVVDSSDARSASIEMTLDRICSLDFNADDRCAPVSKEDLRFLENEFKAIRRENKLLHDNVSLLISRVDAVLCSLEPPRH